MLKIERFRIQYLLSAALLALFGIFLSCQFFSAPRPAYADDGTPIRTTSEDFFVTIHDRDTSITVKTGSTTVAEILAQSGITIAETDLVEPSLDTVISSDYNINVYRARPAIVVDGTIHHYIMTASYDPVQIAHEAGITVYDGDEVTIEFNTNFLEAGAVSTYRVEHHGGTTITVDEAMPYTTETRYDYMMAKGTSYLEQAGEDGRRISKYEVKFENGIETSRELISAEVTREPVPEIIVVGAQPDIPAERAECAAWAREAGVSEADLEVALELIYHESGCRIDATNAYSGAYGIPQALPGDKMAAFGDDWQTNPVTQIRWMISYVNDRYGGWQQAMDYWWQHYWY